MASPYVSARIGNNPGYPFEVKVGIMVRQFDNRKEALRYAIRENQKSIKEEEEMLRQKIRDLQIFEGFDLLCEPNY